MDKRGSHIIFRNLGESVPPLDCNWQVEYHEGRGFPSGIAWVLAAKGSRAVVTFVLVVDDCRRRGIATRLIEECRKRWPDLNLTGPTSSTGLALYRKLQPPAAPENYFNAGFIRRF